MPEPRTTPPEAKASMPEARTTPPEARTPTPEAKTSMPEAKAPMPATVPALPTVSASLCVPWHRARHEQRHQQCEQHSPLLPRAYGLVPVAHRDLLVHHPVY